MRCSVNIGHAFPALGKRPCSSPHNRSNQGTPGYWTRLAWAHPFRQTGRADLLPHPPSVIRGKPRKILALMDWPIRVGAWIPTAATEDALAHRHGTGRAAWLCGGHDGEQDVINPTATHYTINGGHPLMPRVYHFWLRV